MSIFDPSLGTDFLVNVGLVVVTAVVCLSPLGTKITDFFKGIPADVRASVEGIASDASAKLKAAAAAPKVAAAKKPVSPATVAVAAAAAAAAAPAPAPLVPAPAPAPLSPTV